MSTQPEAKLSRKIKDKLNEQGGWFFKVHGSALMMAGLPDLIGCWRGRFIGLEVKMPDKRDNTSVRQDYVHSLILKAGGVVAVVCSPEEALEVVRTVDREMRST